MTSSDSQWPWVALVAVLGVITVQAGGRLAELWWMGDSDEAAFLRVERDVTTNFAEMASSLELLASHLATRPEVIEGIGGNAAALPQLFDVTRTAPATLGVQGVALTVYDSSAAARAWTGRPSEIPPERILGERTFFVAPGSLGLRLVYIEPVVEPDSVAGDLRRIGSIAAERVLSPARGVIDTTSDAFGLASPIAGVALRAHYESGDTEPGPRSFELRSPPDERLLEATVSDIDLRRARANWRNVVWTWTLAWLAFVVVVSTMPDLRRVLRGATVSASLGLAARVAGGLGAASLLLRVASTPGPTRGSFFLPDVYSSLRFPGLLRSPADLVIWAVVGVGLVLVAAALLERLRVASRGVRAAPSAAQGIRFVVTHGAGGIALAAILVGLHTMTDDAVASASVDLLHTSLSPWDPGRIGVLGGLMLTAVGAVWGGVVALVATRMLWRHPRHQLGPTLAAVAAWSSPSVAVMAVTDEPALPHMIVLGGVIVTVLCVPVVRPWFRHASHASRMLALFLAIVLPTLLLYPPLWHHADRSKRRFVEARYAEQSAGYPDELQTQLARSLTQIDQIPELQTMTAGSASRPGDRPDTDRAFFVWRQTDLAQLRLTSAVELYGADGGLISRFALNFPEYAGVPQDWVVSGCGWEVFGEAAPFGSEERRILTAERAICGPGESGPAGASSRGSVVVHLALDYQALPFISSQDPYAELLRDTPRSSTEGETGQDVELVIYGWGRQPIFSSGPSAWLLDDDLFDQVYSSRTPFWTRRSKSGRPYEVYLVNNRAGIYALGYPVFGLFDHLVRLAEITALVGLACLLFVVLAVCITPFTPGAYRFGRALLREVRTSFYRRLFLAFVAATVIPVLAFAFVIRTYITAQLRADVETGAARTAAVAQRVIEESFGLQQTGEASGAIINDDLLVFISQVIDQDVNIFAGAQLIATSERDLYASGLLPTRTPDAVYDAIALDHMPSYVVEDSIGSLRYLVAATPIHAGGRDAILTVSLASRQQEIEGQIADLDRGILLGVTLFVLLGAGSGLYLAERIADPVSRLTRATRQIARGNFEAQVIVKSADELERLVAAFNRMAIDLKDQQQKLERTHRLEAWAEMARQVAHEIKNPLTPVQLSAEHLLRVNRDRGEPLSPVLQSCVESILTQVRILRQISSEFSSYASSPTVTPEETALADLVHEVLSPYLVGLEDRIAVTIDIPSDLPLVSIDRTLIGRALTNVIENALHAMPGQGALDIRGVVTAARVVLTVVDNGVGVDDATLKRIFEPYFSTKVSGTGLGMAIAKRNVDLSGGAISVESVKDRGTTVMLTFPIETSS